MTGALQEAQAWFEQALTVLDALPESQATLEQGVEMGSRSPGQ